MSRYAANPEEERIFDYRPNISEILDPIHSRDDSRTTKTSFLRQARGLTKSWIRNNASHAVHELSVRRKLISSLEIDFTRYLSDMKYSIDASILLRGTRDDGLTNILWYDIIGADGRLDFETYASLPDTDEYKPIHDLWFRRSADTAGNPIAEAFPLLKDMLGDVSRMERLTDGILLSDTGMDHTMDPTVIQSLSIRQAERYESALQLESERMSRGDSRGAYGALLECRTQEHRLRHDQDISNSIVICSRTMDKSIGLLHNLMEKETAGTYRNKAATTLDAISGITDLSAVALPLLRGFKQVFESVVRDRLAQTNDCSTDTKAKLVEDVLRYGRTYRKVTLPMMVRMITDEIPVEAEEGLHHLADGLADILAQSRSAMAQIESLARRETRTRERMLGNMDYKGLAREIYNQKIGGTPNA